MAQGSTATICPPALTGTGSGRYRNFGDCSRPAITRRMPVVKSPPLAWTASSSSISAGVSGRRYARRPKLSMKRRAQAASPLAGSHGKMAFRFAAALPAMASAASAYLPMSMACSGLAVLLWKRSWTASSPGSALGATASATPSRSRTVFRYWLRVSRRIGATAALTLAGAMGCMPGCDGEPPPGDMPPDPVPGPPPGTPGRVGSPGSPIPWCRPRCRYTPPPAPGPRRPATGASHTRAHVMK